MRTNNITFQVAEINFNYIYEYPIIISENMTINHFIIDNFSNFDIINEIYIESNLDLKDYSKKTASFETPAWSLYEKTVIFHPNGKLLAKMEFINDYRYVKTYLNDLDTTVHPLPICITGFLLQRYLTSNKNGFIMHGATIGLGTKGLIFTGNSGVGKSTISSIFRQADNIEQISDDRFILKEIDGTLYSFGNPFDTKIERNINKGIRISNIFFLHHANNNKVSPINSIELMSKLLTVSLLPYGNTTNMEWALQYIKKIATEIPCFEFHFFPDITCFEYIKSILQGDIYD